MKIFIAIIFAVVALAMTTEAVPDKVVCYYGSWSRYRPGNGYFTIGDINPKLCTHLIYAFVGLDAANNDVIILDAPKDITDKTFVDLKSQNPKLKVLVAIGGWNEGSTKYSNVVSNPTSRATFVKNIVAFVKQHKFDGFDIDWEYPAQRGGASSDKENYILFLKELRAKFNPEGFLLTAAVGASQNSLDPPCPFGCCEGNTYLPHPSECDKYLWCLYAGVEPILQECVIGRYWDINIHTCNFKENVKCDTD